MKHQTFSVSIGGEIPDGKTEDIRKKLIQAISNTDFGFVINSVGAKAGAAEAETIPPGPVARANSEPEKEDEATQVSGRKAKTTEKL